MRPPSKRPLLEAEQVGDVTLARVTPAAVIDDRVIQAIGEQLSGLLRQAHRPQVVLSFASVGQLSSAFLSKLITARQQAQAAGGRLALCALAPDLLVVFKVTGFDKLFNIYPGEQEALQSF